MKWIEVKDRKPDKKDSPILADREGCAEFKIVALNYREGWAGPGWYDHSEEYGMGLNEGEAFYNEYTNMIRWIKLEDYDNTAE